MTDHELEGRLRRWYAAEVGNDEAAPASLYHSVTAMREAVGLQPGSHGLRSRLLLLAAAALLVGLIAGSVAVGSGLVKLPAILPAPSVQAKPSSIPTEVPWSAPRLAYGLEGDIYLADLDGGNAVRVADGVAWTDGGSQCGYFGGEGLMWAPDGRHFAYRSSGGDTCSGEVHVRDAEGRLVASVPGFGWDVGWSPDSTRFATWIDFWSTIGIYSLEGERQAILTLPLECVGSGDHDPLWSLTATSVIVDDCDVPIDGGAPLLIPFTDPRAFVVSTGWGASYSPDGTRIAYLSSGGDGHTAGQELVIAEANGTVLQVVHEESAPSLYLRDLVWSPSGDRLLFSRTPRTEDGDALDAASELRQVDIGSWQVTTIAAEQGIHPIRFSPDGDRILFAISAGSRGYTGLWIMDADGSHIQRLVPNTGFGDWRPSPATTEP